MRNKNAVCLRAMLGMLALLCCVRASPAQTPLPTAYEQQINTDWKFFRADGPEPASPEAAAFNDASWQAVTLPHTPRIEKYDETHPWQGVCWYRKTLAPLAAWAGKRVGIQFGAAMQVADVWVNGVPKMRHLGGYLPFTVDLTPEAAAGKPITIAVRLDNRDTKLVPPGKPTNDLDFNYPGGLYRGVRLIVTDPLHITDPVAANIVAGGGIFVTYSDVSAQSATVHIKTDVANDGDALVHQCRVRSSLLDSAGQMVASVLSEPTLLSTNDHHEFVQTLIVSSPRLWHPDHPSLYTLRTTVSRDSHAVDEVQTRIGIRSFVLDSRVRINGQEFHMMGSNRHQEYPYIEYALSPNAGKRDAQRIKDGGFNHIRLSHYPQDPAFLDACDELGILVQAPIPGWQIFNDNPSFVTGTYQNIRDLIRRDRNHPSIIFWEPNLNETGPPKDWCRTAYEIAHEEYPGPECYTFGDSYPAGWHPGWDVKHFIREYGDFGFGGNESTSRQTRGQGELAMLQQTWNFLHEHNGNWAQWSDPNSKFYGDATWVMFDYNRGYYPKQEHSGMMDIFRLPKYVYRFFQSQRDPHLIRQDIESGPMVFVASDWAKRPSPSRVVVFSNCDEVALSVNGKLIARQKPDAGPDTPYSPKKVDLADTNGTVYDNSGGYMFDGGNAKHLDHPPFTFVGVPYAPGTLQAVGYIGGKPVAEQTVQTPGIPVSLKVTFDTQRRPLAADGADTVFVRAEILDKSGTAVPLNALPSLTLTVSGPAHLIQIDSLHVEAGVASALLQAYTEAGMISVTAHADGLKSATAALTSQAAETLISRTPVPPTPKAAHAVPASFTKLSGKIIGTTGSFKDGPTTIAQAFDGNINTAVDAAASTGGDDCWLGLDLGTPRPITRIRFYPRLNWVSRMAGGKFQGSSTPDFAAPVDLYTLDDAPTNGQWTEITDLASAQPFRYVRYLSPEDGWNNIAELEFDTSP